MRANNMHKQGKLCLGQCASVLFLLFAAIFLFAQPATANEIDACKYLFVTDFTSDPYGIAAELRSQAQKNGFTLITSVAEVPADDSLKVCTMAGNWSRTGSGGEIDMRIVESASGALLAEASTRAIDWWGVGRTVRKAVAKIYVQLGYTGFKEEVYKQMVERLFPTRPKIPTSEEQIKKSKRGNLIEGIWTDPQDKYRLGVVPATEGSGVDYFAVILSSNSPVWQPGEIKAEIRSTASQEIFTCTYFAADKKPVGTTLSLEHTASLLRGSLSTPKGPVDLLLVRVWPARVGDPPTESSEKNGPSGTGFLLNKTGLVATNWHVVADAKSVAVTFPGWSDSLKAEIVLRDVVNDLAILRVGDATKLKTTCPELPFELASSVRIQLGQHVFTVGYPLTSLLGSNPKFSEGVIASKTGFQDDPRSFQITAQVQPGSSGSPLFDGEGNVIGIVVATLDAGKLYQEASVLPQNVNWAIKSDYLLNLIGMLPGQVRVSRETSFTPEKAAGCVAIITTR